VLPEYVFGKVLEGDLDTVTLQIGTGERTISLPDNAFAPPKNSEVVAVLSGDGNRATFLQPIDELISTLQR
jgi:hypothetical protein